MRPLLFDTSVLLAVYDREHLDHERTHRWLDSFAFDRWATCPITENGFIRIISQPRYPHPISTELGVAELCYLRERNGHEFWSDAISLSDPAVCKASLLTSHGRVTDTYLLALAKSKNGLFVTLDKRISVAAIGNGSDYLALIP